MIVYVRTRYFGPSAGPTVTISYHPLRYSVNGHDPASIVIWRWQHGHWTRHGLGVTT